jgi:hypothetical protein
MKLSKAQRDQLVMVIVGTVAVGAALWYFVVNDRDQALAQTRTKAAQTRDKLSKGDDLLRKAETISETLQSQSNKLWAIESGLAPDRDAYSWVITNLNSYVNNWKAQEASEPNVPAKTVINTALPHEVNITSCSPPDVVEKGLIPHFPYRWATFHVKGLAYFHDLGKFISDFENAYPYFRVQNLDIAPSSGVNAEPEKLNFSFDIVSPIQPTAQDTR